MSDYGEKKGFHIFDTETQDLEFVKNPHTIFTQIRYDDSQSSDTVPLSVDEDRTRSKYVRIIVEKKTKPYLFEKFVDWQQLISCDDNFKNILQVKIQKEFKTTPAYLEISRDSAKGYVMGVYLCLGKPIHSVNPSDATQYCDHGSFSEIQKVFAEKKHVFVRLGTGTHCVKKKAEQSACEAAIETINSI